MLDNLNLFELVLLTLSLMGGQVGAYLFIRRRVLARWRKWRVQGVLHECRMASLPTYPRLVQAKTDVSAPAFLRAGARVSDSRQSFSEQSGYLGTTLRISDQKDDTRVGRTAPTGPSPYRINGSDSHSG